MRPRSIRIEMCHILSLLTHFHDSLVSHSNFVDRLAPSVSMMRTASQSNAFQTDAIQFEEVKARQLKWETVKNRDKS
jgi:hypothetical protein